jgi:hypothetical protein
MATPLTSEYYGNSNFAVTANKCDPTMRERKDPDSSDITAFKNSQQSLRNKLATAKINRKEFQRRLKGCSLSTCLGTCCYDGASVDDETAKIVQQLADDRRSDFTAMGLNLPETVIESSEWNGVVGKKTKSRPFQRPSINDYPAHFNKTACVFLLKDGRCGLQILSEADGKHRWYYKPFTCWLHPIKLSKDAIRLYDETSDPNILPKYPGFVIRAFCGRTEECGRPAAEVLAEELDFLGKLLDRDLLSEVQSATSKRRDKKAENPG